ncbi:hypothetical protein OE88DRAFT_1809749 [Heliocybe sulcata]|uniref:Uncharacterized protein n=1 Tax=Heliocybe sulcata TaxID=5364 RepID=A0A5C3MZ47_9AGAM|nr:hypothetical protein OE88DRAFT_1809749 [Heliocybe sulcata]
MSTLNWNQESLVILLVILIIYGAYLLIFAACVYALLYRQKNMPLRRTLLLIIVILFGFTTTQTMLTWWQSFVSTNMDSGDSAQVQRAQYFVQLSSCISDITSPIANLVADGLLAWCCYVVWNRKVSIIIIPLILIVAETVFGIAIPVFQLQAFLLPIETPSQVAQWYRLFYLVNVMGIVFYVCSAVTNLLMSGLIAFRIWTATRYVGAEKRKAQLKGTNTRQNPHRPKGEQQPQSVAPIPWC